MEEDTIDKICPKSVKIVTKTWRKREGIILYVRGTQRENLSKIYKKAVFPDNLNDF